MNATILNREFKHPSDGWYHVEAIGEHPNRQAGVVQVIDSEAVRAIVNRFNSEADDYPAQNGGEDFPGMLIDIEHFSHDQDKETRGYGWLMRLENRSNDPNKPGIYGQVNWTGSGKRSVDGGDYRYFSSEYDPADLTIVNRVGDVKRVRPLRLAGLTLTNRPNNRGQRPITNRTLTETAAAAEKADIQNKQKEKMKTIATRLGLSADASEEAILGELTKLQNRATQAEKDLKDAKDENTKITNRVNELAGAQADTDLDAAGIKEDDADRPALKKALIENRETGLAFLKKIKPAESQTRETKAPLTNRQSATTPTKGQPNGDEAKAAAEQKRAVQIRNRAESKIKDNSMAAGAAWRQAEAEVDSELATAGR